MKLDEALTCLSQFYGTNNQSLKCLLDSTYYKKNILLPFCNKIFENNCKAIVFNHGLYTQCCENIQKNESDICKKCKALKYGRIEERLNIPKNEFITKEGKKEVPYEKIIQKMNYNIDEVKRELNHRNLTYNIDVNKFVEKKNGRGRPKKNQEHKNFNDISITCNNSNNNNEFTNEEEYETVEVIAVNINGIDYYKTRQGTLINVE